MTMINKCLDKKASVFDRPILALLQVLWEMVINRNVDYADLIWEDFKFQIDSRQISTEKKELLPFPRFTKLIIKYILSHHNIVSKRLQSNKHGIKLDAVLKNLKFANKGEKDPIYGMEIPKDMLSDEIKASTDYLNYLAKSMGTQPAKGRGKGLLTKKGVEVVVEKIEIIWVPKKKRTETVIEETRQSEEVANTVDSEETDEDEVRLNERQTSIIIGRGFHKKSEEGTLDHSKSNNVPKAYVCVCVNLSYLEVPDGLSNRSDSSSSKSEDEEGFLSTDDEASQEKSEDERTKVDDSEKAKDVKDADEQARKEQAMDEQAGIDQLGKVQAKVSVPDPQVEKPATQLLSTSLTLSSAEYGNQFINDNPDVSLTNVLKDLAEIEILSMVDAPIHQEDPAVQRPRLVDTVISIIIEKKTALPKQQPPQTQPKRSKTKLILKKLKKPKKQVDDDVILKRVTRLENKVKATSKIDHSKAINKSVQAHLKKVLPTYASDFDENDMGNQFDDPPTQKKRRHNDEDPSADADKETKKRRLLDTKESSKKNNDQAVDVEESIGDNVVGVEDPTQEDADANLEKSKWFKQDVVFNELVNAEKDPKQFDDLMGLTIDFMKFAKNCLKKDKIMKVDLEGPTFMLLKGNYKNNIELEYNMEQCYLALMDQSDWANPEGDRCPYDFTKPLSLQVPPGCTTIPIDFFFNKYLEYLKTGNKEIKYASSLTKPKAAMYELEGLEEMIPKLWSSSKVQYDKDDALRIHHYGSKRQLFYRARHGRSNQKESVFNEANFSRLHLNDIEDMLLIYVQNKIHHLKGDEQVDLINALRLFTQRIVLNKRVEDYDNPHF
ncbi:hypothetical protein Tco_0776999 [Tanacetum coccineum]